MLSKNSSRKKLSSSAKAENSAEYEIIKNFEPSKETATRTSTATLTKPADFLAELQSAYPEFIFRLGARSHFRFPKTIIVSENEPYFELVALHELSHALLKHQTFTTDIDRLKKETAAWSLAKSLAEKYSVKIDEDFIESELDSYRDWLHSRSKCPACGLTRYQTPDGVYHCPRCENFS